MKIVEYNDLEDIIIRMELTYHEIAELSDTVYICAKTDVCTLPPDIYEISVVNLMIKSLLPDEIKANTTINDIRQK